MKFTRTINLPEGCGIGRPKSHFSEGIWSSYEEEHVPPVKFLILRHHKRLSIAFNAVRQLCICLLFLQWQTKELPNIIFHLLHQLKRHPMVY